MTAATPAQRKAAERARKAAAGLAEVRGIHAPAEHHPEIKEAALKHASRLTRAKARKQQKQQKEKTP